MKPMSDAQHRAWCVDAECVHKSHRLPAKPPKPAEKPRCCVHECFPEDDPRVPFECVNIPKPIRERRLAEAQAGLPVGSGKAKGFVGGFVKRRYF